jgi:hypothetical protein
MSIFRKSKPPEPKRTSSGSFAAVAARKKMVSIDESTMPLIDEANSALDRMLASIPPTQEQAAEAEAEKAKSEPPQTEKSDVDE